MKKEIKIRPKKMLVVRPSNLYEQDFHKWLKSQSRALRKKDFAGIDIKNLVEEIESLGKSDKRALSSHLINLMKHLLKLKVQPEKQATSDSWQTSINNARIEIALILEDSPSLKSGLNRMIDHAYQYARKGVSDETKLPIDRFPIGCPWTKAELLN